MKYVCGCSLADTGTRHPETSCCCQKTCAHPSNNFEQDACSYCSSLNLLTSAEMNSRLQRNQEINQGQCYYLPISPAHRAHLPICLSSSAERRPCNISYPHLCGRTLASCSLSSPSLTTTDTTQSMQPPQLHKQQTNPPSSCTTQLSVSKR